MAQFIIHKIISYKKEPIIIYVMRKLSLLALAIICCCLSAVAADNAVLPEYELTGNGTGAQGTYLLTVTIINKNKNVTNADLARCAVHGVLFRGFANKEKRQSQKPLAGGPSSEASHTDYFRSFFADGGPYASYVSEVSGSRQVIKAGKQYKISATVTVNKDRLRHDLENDGIIKGLNSIF